MIQNQLPRPNSQHGQRDVIPVVTKAIINVIVIKDNDLQTLSGDKRVALIVKGDLFIRSAGDNVYLFQLKLMAIRSMLLLTHEQM